MYLQYFGFHKPPFSIAPDPHNLYLSLQHREALAHLLFGATAGGGFVLLTGEIGTGKTTLCRCLLEQLPESCDVAFIFNPKLTALELLLTICDELHIDLPATGRSTKALVDCINAYLLNAHAAGRNTLLIIDEAQNLSANVLEQMRLLTNLETTERKLLQIILLGQPELRQKLARPELAQLAQRIIARFHLGPLPESDLAGYISHRIATAGSQRKLIPRGLVSSIYRATLGVPRAVNLVCDRALLGAYVEGKEQVDRKVLAKAVREVRGEDDSHSRWPALRWALGAMTVGGVGLFAAFVVGPVKFAAYVDRDALASVWVNLWRPINVSAVAIPPIRTAAGGNLPAKGPTDAAPVGIYRARDETAAWKALFSRWGLAYRDDSVLPPCEQALSAGLRCLSAHGTLEDLRDLNQPALLQLKTAKGNRYAVLSGLSATTVMLEAEEGVIAREASEVVNEWTGHYTVLWRVPPDYSGVMERGDRGAAVVWLRRQLVQLGRLPPATQYKTVFDFNLWQQVQRFQKEQGMRTNGSFGPHTAIRLMAALDSQVPQLAPSKKDN